MLYAVKGTFSTTCLSHSVDFSIALKIHSVFLTPVTSVFYFMNFRSLLFGLSLTFSVAQAVVIEADISDFEVFSDGGVSAGTDGDLAVGDTGGTVEPNLGRRSLVRFDITGLNSGVLDPTYLNLSLIQTRKDQFPDPGIISSSAPFVNPGLGDLLVVHVADYDSPDASDFNSVSIGNDPGVLIGAGVEAGAFLSIDVTAAVQQAINSSADFVAFRLETAVESDLDGLNDIFFFASANNTDASLRPTIEVVPEPSTYALFAIGLIALAWRYRSIA